MHLQALLASTPLRRRSQTAELDVCVAHQDAPDAMIDAARDVACAMPSRVSLRSYTAVMLGAASIRPTMRQLSRPGAMLRADAVTRAALRQELNATPTMSIHIYRSVVPSVLETRTALPSGACDMLLLRMDGDTANVRQSLRIDLPHALRLAAPGALIIAHSSTVPAELMTRCLPSIMANSNYDVTTVTHGHGRQPSDRSGHGRQLSGGSKTSGSSGSSGSGGGSRGGGWQRNKARGRKPPSATAIATANMSKYTGPFSRHLEQCWLERWSDLITARTVRAVAPCATLAPSFPRMTATAWHASGTATTAFGRQERGALAALLGTPPAVAQPAITWCAGLMSSRSLCARRVPLLRALNASREVVRFTDERIAAPLLRTALRYFSVIDCTEGGGELTDALGSRGASTASSSSSAAATAMHARAVCLIFKNEVQETWVGGLRSTDGLAFHGEPSLVYPKHAKTWPRDQRGVLTHNFAIARVANGAHTLTVPSRPSAVRGVSTAGADVDVQSSDGSINKQLEYVIVGGTHRNRALSGAPHLVNGFHQGIWLARGHTWLYDPRSNQSIGAVDSAGTRVSGATQWHGKRVTLRGSHHGCIERRDRIRMPWIIKDTCEFDGRLSLVARRGELLLYARANMAKHGQRFVQHTRSVDGGVSWSQFQPIQLQGYEHMEGDIYFWAAQVNPVDGTSLVAAFPVRSKTPASASGYGGDIPAQHVIACEAARRLGTC